MIMRHTPLYLATLLFVIGSPISQANDTQPDQKDGVTIGLATLNAPRYSGSNERQWDVLPVIQARQGAFFFDTAKGAGYDLQFGQFYLEHTLGYAAGRTDKNTSFQAGSDKLRGMGKIRGALNTALTLGFEFTDQLSLEAKAIAPLTDSQGMQYQTSVNDAVSRRVRYAGSTRQPAVRRCSLQQPVLWRKHLTERQLRLSRLSNQRRLVWPVGVGVLEPSLYATLGQHP